MKPHGILFNGAMVRAIRDGRKTQTRRILDVQPSSFELDEKVFEGHNGGMVVGPDEPPEGYQRHRWWRFDTETDARLEYLRLGKTPTAAEIKRARRWHFNQNYGEPLRWSHGEVCALAPQGPIGRKLWVRETFYCDHASVSEGGRLPKERPEWADGNVYYHADGSCCEQIPECACAEVGKPKWRPSIHMPQWAARIWLEVTEIRCQRLQEISEADTVAEGVSGRREGSDLDAYWISAKEVYAALWESINGPGSWDANPWVWAYTFKRIEKP